jgi:hypothetical protein
MLCYQIELNPNQLLNATNGFEPQCYGHLAGLNETQRLIFLFYHIELNIRRCATRSSRRCSLQDWHRREAVLLIAVARSLGVQLAESLNVHFY